MTVDTEDPLNENEGYAEPLIESIQDTTISLEINNESDTFERTVSRVKLRAK